MTSGVVRVMADPRGPRARARPGPAPGERDHLPRTNRTRCGGQIPTRPRHRTVCHASGATAHVSSYLKAKMLHTEFTAQTKQLNPRVRLIPFGPCSSTQEQGPA
jgi:hypothetical protein